MPAPVVTPPTATDSANPTDQGITADADDILAGAIDLLRPPEADPAEATKPTIPTDTETDDDEAGDSATSEGDDDETEGDGETDSITEKEGADDETDDDETDDDDDETDDEETEEEEEADAEDKAKLSANAQKRFDKLTAKNSRYQEERDTAREENSTLKEKLAEAQRTAVTLPPSTSNPLANLSTKEEIDERTELAQKVLNWASLPDNREGAQIGETYYSAEEMADKRHAAEMDLKLHIPARSEWIAKNKAADKEARELYPFLYEEGDFNDWANQWLADAPGIMQSPDYMKLMGKAAIGHLVDLGHYQMVPVKAPAAKTKKAKEAKARAKAKAPATTPPAAPSKTTPAQRPGAEPKEAAQKRLLDSAGSDNEALADIVAGFA